MIYLLISLIVLVWLCCVLCALMLFKLCNLECSAHWIYQQIEELKNKINKNSETEIDLRETVINEDEDYKKIKT